jgi:Ca-activated chloride channel homolog
MMHDKSNALSARFQAMPGLENGLKANALESVEVVGCIRDLTCELTVKQSFVNLTDSCIEAIYSFPLPHEAVLLDLRAKIGKRELRAKVKSKKNAEMRYEQALLFGDRALLLEQADEDVLSISLGNLMPGERVVLIYDYAYLLAWRQDTVSFNLPTTIAPRYGNPDFAGYQPHQIPVASILADNRFSLSLSVEGLLSAAEFACPSHAFNVVRQKNKVNISLKEYHAPMDRDFVLHMKLASGNKSAGIRMTDTRSQKISALVSFCTEIPTADIPGLCLKIVVDCSASMSGIALRQAQLGLLQVLENLRETDSFNLLKFGAEHQAVFPHCVAVTPRSLRYARQEILNLSAEMGGTEIGAALECAYALSDLGRRAMSVLLVTDGQTYQHRDVIHVARKSVHRIFTVGVGSAAASGFLNDIAEQTGGACEIVTPLEPMEDAIRRQFRRMLQARAVQVKLMWPNTVIWQAPQTIPPLFSGDTIHVFAELDSSVEGEAELLLLLDDGRQICQKVELSRAENWFSSMPRVAVAKRLKEIPEKLAAKLAKEYNLLSRFTDFLLVDHLKAADKQVRQPKLVQTVQLLAAGWGGTAGAWEPEAYYASRSAKDLLNSDPVFIATFNEFEPIEHDKFYKLSADEPLYSQFCGTGINKLALLMQVSRANEQWLEEFMSLVLIQLHPALQEIFQELIAGGGWNASDVAAAILLLFAGEMCFSTDNPFLECEFESIKDYVELIDCLQVMLKEDVDTDLRRAIMTLPCKQSVKDYAL